MTTIIGQVVTSLPEITQTTVTEAETEIGIETGIGTDIATETAAKTATETMKKNHPARKIEIQSSDSTQTFTHNRLRHRLTTNRPMSTNRPINSNRPINTHRPINTRKIQRVTRGLDSKKFSPTTNNNSLLRFRRYRNAPTHTRRQSVLLTSDDTDLRCFSYLLSLCAPSSLCRLLSLGSIIYYSPMLPTVFYVLLCAIVYHCSV